MLELQSPPPTILDDRKIKFPLWPSFCTYQRNCVADEIGAPAQQQLACDI
jgi:hypothetical protein